MSSVFQPRDCGPGAWRAWFSGAWTSLRRWPWEALLALAVGLSAWGWAAGRWPGFVVPLIVAGLALRPVFEAWFDRTRQAVPLGMLEAWSLTCAHWPSWARVWVFLVAVGVGVGLQLGIVWKPAASVVAGMGSAWMLGLWLPLAFRPWGPIGFWGQLFNHGCPVGIVAKLQFAAVALNPTSLGLLAGAWFAALMVLMLNEWMVPLAWVLWVLVCRGAFVDIFQGGLTMEQRETVAVAAVSQVRATR